MSIPGFNAAATLSRSVRSYATPNRATLSRGQLAGVGPISTEPRDPDPPAGPSCGKCKCDPGQECSQNWLGHCKCT
jgi:hypothetical protein